MLKVVFVLFVHIIPNTHQDLIGIFNKNLMISVNFCTFWMFFWAKSFLALLPFTEVWTPIEIHTSSQSLPKLEDFSIFWWFLNEFTSLPPFECSFQYLFCLLKCHDWGYFQPSPLGLANMFFQLIFLKSHGSIHPADSHNSYWEWCRTYTGDDSLFFE